MKFYPYTNQIHLVLQVNFYNPTKNKHIYTKSSLHDFRAS